MRIALAQVNATVGDIDGNARQVISGIAEARSKGVQLVVFQELVTLGYPPKDLLLRRALVDRNVEVLTSIASACIDITAVVGYVQRDPTGDGTGLLNSAAVCRNGRIELSYAKNLLPTYDVFDETRYFNPGSESAVFDVPDGDGCLRVGLTICEDLWGDEQFGARRVYDRDPVGRTVKAGAKLILNIAASPFEAGKLKIRESLFAGQAREHRVPVVCVNQIGGNDDLLFDGASAVFDSAGLLTARAKAFAEDLLVFDMADAGANRIEPYPDRVNSIRRALVVGTRDYVRKCGFAEVIIGLSGGIDSAVTAAVAVEALGAERVHGLAMPSRYSSDHSIEDAQELADNLGILMDIVSIEKSHRAVEQAMQPLFADRRPGVTEENIQARIRGNFLMSLSNKFGYLLLTTGNKSELAVGYCTLYGDMCGGLAVLSDVPKTVVYELAELMNATSDKPCIPRRSIDKPPSAELCPDQTDQDSLPPYDVLDAILEGYVEREESVDTIAKAGFDRALVERIARLVDLNEYKRKQAAVGLKVTSRAFGTGRRMPVAARYR